MAREKASRRLASSCHLASVVFLLIIKDTQAISKCTIDKSICGCQTDQGAIDLRPLSKKPLVAQEPSGTQYFWNVCKDFNKGAIVASSIQFFRTGTAYDLGVYSSIKSDVDKGKARFTLKAADGARTTSILCNCEEGNEYNFKSELPRGHYNLELTSQHCCPSGDSGGGSSSGLSAGSILVIIFFATFGAYFIGGIIIQSALRKAEGRERIPNVDFWAAIPGLVVDGLRFTFTCGKSPSYAEI